MTKQEYNPMELLEAVDERIRNAEQRYDEILWDDPLEETKTLSSVLLELDHLYLLREQGVIYEPVF